MKAKFVNENLDFERGKDPKEAMDIGQVTLQDIDTTVDTCEMTISQRNLVAYIYFDPDGWDDAESAMNQIEGFAEGTHDLIDFGEIEETLAEHGYEVGDGDWEADGWQVSLPIKRIG